MQTSIFFYLNDKMETTQLIFSSLVFCFIQYIYLSKYRKFTASEKKSIKREDPQIALNIKYIDA